MRPEHLQLSQIPLQLREKMDRAIKKKRTAIEKTNYLQGGAGRHQRNRCRHFMKTRRLFHRTRQATPRTRTTSPMRRFKYSPRSKSTRHNVVFRRRRFRGRQRKDIIRSNRVQRQNTLGQDRDWGWGTITI